MEADICMCDSYQACIRKIDHGCIKQRKIYTVWGIERARETHTLQSHGADDHRQALRLAVDDGIFPPASRLCNLGADVPRDAL